MLSRAGMDLDRERERMVDEQLRRRGIADTRVLAAMGAVPREAFVPKSDRARAYYDGALPLSHGQTISQPLMVAMSVEALRLSGDETVLEVGAGSGYQAAILSKLAKKVYAIEIVPELLADARRSLTGWAIETWATQPAPKKLLGRAKVRSMNWSTRTRCPGAYSSFREPTAEIETMSVTPARFIASMFAR